MKKTTSLLIILNLLVSIFSFIPIAEAGTSSEVGCCIEFNSGPNIRYCDQRTQADCNSGMFRIGNCQISLSVPECRTVYCSGGGLDKVVSRKECLDKGGTIGTAPATIPVTGGEALNPEVVNLLEMGGCIINYGEEDGSKCREYTNRGKCIDLARPYGGLSAGTGNSFDTTIRNRVGCVGENVLRDYPRMGCCKTGNTCQRIVPEDCTAINGMFNRNRCSDVQGCNCGPSRRECSEDHKSITIKDSCGTEDLQELGRNEICYVDENGVVKTKSTECKNGQVGHIGEIKWRGVILIEEREVTYDSKILGGKDRKNGDEWCYSTGTGKNPGDSYYVLKCNEGSIEQNRDADIFRATICDENRIDENKVLLASNLWEDCMKCGEGEGHWYEFGFRAGCNEDECYNLGLPPGSDLRNLPKSEKVKLSHCVFSSDGKNECWPKYPPGYEFWKSESETIVNKVDGESVRRCDGDKNKWGCGQGGDAKMNRCDSNECSHLGDCEIDGKDYTSGIWTGTKVGFVVGTSVALIGSGVAGGAWEKITAIFTKEAATKAGTAAAAAAGAQQAVGGPRDDI